MSQPVESILLPTPNFDEVPMVLFRRHIGLPARAELDEQLIALYDQAKTWYAEHGEPWTEARQVAIQRIVYDVIHLEPRLQLSSALFARGLARAEARAIVVVGVSAGAAVDKQIDSLWKSGRVDEAMFLNAYAIATVEHLRQAIGELLRSAFSESATTVLPHYSPGYEGWDLGDQSRLFQLLAEGRNGTALPIQLLPSGGLNPSKSTLAAFGLTQRTDFKEDLHQYWSCRSAPSATVRSCYSFPEKALMKWRDNRLQVTALPNQELLASFRFDGSTCTNIGAPLAFEYHVKLRREVTGEHRILSSACQPAQDHLGFQSMCAYLDKPDRFMEQLNCYQPLVSQPLSDSLTWQTPTSPAGCLCTRASQDHKWRIVFQTLHFALNNHE